jgi:hypothetical protein
MAAATLWLPPLSALRAAGPLPNLSALLRRAQALPALTPRDVYEARSAFTLGLPASAPLPVAAITRAIDIDDDTDAVWLRADPAHVRADLGVARLMACGDLGLDAETAAQLAKPLRPLFGDEGFELSTPHPARWYLKLPVGARVPAFAPPESVLGADLHAHLPEGDLGRRWRKLLNEAQVLLHQHPLNRARSAAGLPAVNSLWFWGAGARLERVRSEHDLVISHDALLRGLAHWARIPHRAPTPEIWTTLGANAVLVDLRDQHDIAALDTQWMAPLHAQWRARRVSACTICLASGERAQAHARDAWKFWRRPPF